MTIKDLITLEKFHLLYEKAGKAGPLIINTRCSQCGLQLEVEIYRTSEGFGMNQGVLYATRDGQLIAKCKKCYPGTDPS
jgi:hypothetical protein